MQAPSSTGEEPWRPTVYSGWWEMQRLRSAVQQTAEGVQYVGNEAWVAVPAANPPSNCIYDEIINELTDGAPRSVKFAGSLLHRNYMYGKGGGERWWPTAKSRWRKLRNQLRLAVRLGNQERWLERGAQVYAQVDLWLIQQGLEHWMSAKSRYQ